MSDEQDDRLAEGSPRGEGGLTGYSIPAPTDETAPLDEAVQGTARGGEGLATGAAPQAPGPDPDEAVRDTARGGEGLADGAA